MDSSKVFTKIHFATEFKYVVFTKITLWSSKCREHLLNNYLIYNLRQLVVISSKKAILRRKKDGISRICETNVVNTVTYQIFTWYTICTNWCLFHQIVLIWINIYSNNFFFAFTIIIRDFVNMLINKFREQYIPT